MRVKIEGCSRIARLPDIVKYTITEAGTYTFTVRTNGGVIVTKSVTVVAGGTSMAFSECSGDGLQSAMQNTATSVTISTADAYGNPTVTTTVGFFSYYLVPQPGTATTTTLTGTSTYNSADSTHTVQYTPAVQGRYNLTIYTGSWGGNGDPPSAQVPISGQSFPLVAGVTSPGLAELTTPFSNSDGNAVQTNQIPINQDIFATIQAYSAGTPKTAMTSGGTPFNPRLIPASIGSVYQTVDNSDGTYTIRFRCTTSGTYAITASAFSIDINGGTTYPITVLAGATAAANSVISGDGLDNGNTAGVQRTITIQLRDDNGNNVNGGESANLAVTIDEATGSSPTTLTVTDNGNGLYTYTYTKTTATYYKITATYLGTALPGMPKTIEVVPAPLDYANSVVDTVSLDSKYCKTSNPNNEDIQVVDGTVWQCVQAGSNNFLYVTPRDQYGNTVVDTSAIAAAVGTFSAAWGSNGGTGSISSSLVNGKMRVSYSQETSGSNTIAVTWNSQAVSQGTSKVLIVPAAVDVTQCTIAAAGSGPDVFNTGIGVEAGLTPLPGFVIQAKDTYGNNLLYSGEYFDATFTMGGDQTTGTVSYDASGRYNVAFNIVKSGTYDLAVTLASSNVAGSPTSVKINPSYSSGSMSFTEGAGASVAGAGVTTTFNVVNRDRFGNSHTSNLYSEMVFARYKKDQGSSTWTIATVADLTNGKFSVTYRIEASELHELEVYIGKNTTQYPLEHVAGSPFNLNIVPGPTDPTRCVAYGPGLSSGGAVDELPQEFYIQAQDQYGNNRTEPGEAFTVEYLHISSGSQSLAALNFTTVPSGRLAYSSKKVVTKSGDYDITVKHGGTQIGRNGKTRITAVPGPADALQSTASGLGTTNARTAIPATFTVQARDRFMNDLIGSGLAVTAKLTSQTIDIDSVDKITATVEAKGAGRYEFTYSGTYAGTYLLSTQIAGVDIADSPFNVLMTPFTCSAANPGTPFRCLNGT